VRNGGLRLAPIRRKPDPQQRRRDLCDAAIILLADEGAKGLTHLKVDCAAAVPSGTTSFNFRTRSALLHAVAERVTELDLVDLAAISESAQRREGPSVLAQAVFASSLEPALTRTRARYELLLHSARDPVLRQTIRVTASRFLRLSRAAVMDLQPAHARPTREVIDDQTIAVVAFIEGIMLGFAREDRTVRDAAHLDRLLSAIVTGVAVGEYSANI
jgi:DNA-binding transcriptional regulator YbjK